MNRTAISLSLVLALAAVAGGCAHTEPSDELPDGADWAISEVEGGYEAVAPAPLLAELSDGDLVELGLMDERGETLVTGQIVRITRSRVWLSTSDRLAFTDSLGDTTLTLRRTGSCPSAGDDEVGAMCSELRQLPVVIIDPDPGECSGCIRDGHPIPGLKPYQGNQTICYCM